MKLNSIHNCCSNYKFINVNAILSFVQVKVIAANWHLLKCENINNY